MLGSMKNFQAENRNPRRMKPRTSGSETKILIERSKMKPTKNDTKTFELLTKILIERSKTKSRSSFWGFARDINNF